MRNARLLLTFGLLALVVAAPALAQGQVGGTATARLRGFDEVPVTAVPNSGTFNADINAAGTEIDYTLTYNVPEGIVTQAHLHLGQKGVNGGIVVFLCSNLPNPPAGTQSCPTNSGTISGTIQADDILAIAGQSSLAGDMFSLLRGIRAGVVYVNVHTDQLPGGSIRGQLLFRPGN